MNCRRCEHLMPLYVEGDLPSGLAAQVSEHLDWCGKCNWLFDEYKESQSWLRAPSVPEFGDAELNALKAGILKRVVETSAKPSLFAILMQHWSRKHVFALSTAVLIIVGVVLVYIYQTRARIVVPIPQVADTKPEAQPKQPDEPLAAGKEEVSGPAVNKRHPRPKRRYVRASQAEPRLARRTVEQNSFQARSTAERAGVQTVDSSARFASSPKNMLRIEIQTSDPHIRIIWFAPKETDPHQIKPATD